MFPCLIDDLLSWTFAPHQYDGSKVGNDSRAYDLYIAEAGQEYGSAGLSSEHVTHEIACRARLHRYIQFILPGEHLGMQQLLDFIQADLLLFDSSHLFESSLVSVEIGRRYWPPGKIYPDWRER